MVVAAHRVARDTLALDSFALSSTILLGTSSQLHLLLMSLIMIGQQTIPFAMDRAL